MTIDGNSWHAKLYVWWYQRKYGITPSGANLCPYVRVVLFWSWVRWLLVDGKIGRVYSAALSWSSIGLLIEYVAYLAAGRRIFLAELFGIITLLVGAVIVGIIGGLVYFLTKSKPGKPVRSFIEVLRYRANSFHDRICPRIELKGE